MKVEVHHPKGINWKRIMDAVYEELLCEPEKLEVICRTCHKRITDEQRKTNNK